MRDIENEGIALRVAGHAPPPEREWRRYAVDLPDQQPVQEVALAIAEGHPFTDLDAVRVAAAFLALTGRKEDE